MTAILTSPATSRPAHTITRRAAQLLDSGLAALMQFLDAVSIQFEVEEHQGDYVLAVYRADDTVLVVTGYGVSQYDVARYDLADWDDVHGEPTHAENGLHTMAVLFVLRELRDLPRVA